MKTIHYSKSSPDVQKAYAEFKSTVGNPNAVSFVAGWNALLTEDDEARTRASNLLSAVEHYGSKTPDELRNILLEQELFPTRIAVRQRYLGKNKFGALLAEVLRCWIAGQITY
jgi:hypothetical protein